MLGFMLEAADAPDTPEVGDWPASPERPQRPAASSPDGSAADRSARGPQVGRLVARLAAVGGEATDRAAAAELRALGPGAIPALVAVLLDESPATHWPTAGGLLHGLGPAAFAAVREAVANAPGDEARRRASWAFVGFGVDAMPLYEQSLRHASPRVRADAAQALQCLGEAAAPAALALVALLGDPDRVVQQRALWALKRMGPAVVAPLHLARRRGSRVARRRALEALREVVGDEGLSRRDRVLLDRLVRLRLRGDRPTWFSEESWIAVPGADQAGVMALLDLSHPRPATFVMGLDAVQGDWQALAEHDHPELTRVFITPELAGWTLIVGAWCGPFDESRRREVLAACRQLSRRYGAAHAYSSDAQSDACSWTLASRGEVVHHLAWDGGVTAEEGAPPPCERAARPADLEDHIPFVVYDIAAKCSVSPEMLGPRTPMRGHGLLARTPYGRLHGEPRRALDI